VLRVVPVLLAALSLLACGGDDGGESTPATSENAAAAASTTTAGETTGPATTAGQVAGPTAPPRREPSDPLCVAAADLRDADIDYQVRIAEGVNDALEQQDIGPLNDVLAGIDADGTLVTLLDAYARLSAALPAEQQPHVAKLQAFTEEFFRGVNGLPSFAEVESYMSALREDPDAQAANEAGAALDAYVRQECGAGITAAG
jgi:hypothetical protein